MIADVVTRKLDMREAALLPEGGQEKPMDGDDLIMDNADND